MAGVLIASIPIAILVLGTPVGEVWENGIVLITDDNVRTPAGCAASISTVIDMALQGACAGLAFWIVVSHRAGRWVVGSLIILAIATVAMDSVRAFAISHFNN